MSKQTRQQGALERLQNQLIKGTKTINARGDKEMQVQISLEKADITRINKEIEILKSK